MLDDLAGKRTGERIQILRERRGLARPVRRGRLGVEIARAYYQRHDYPGALHWLGEAYRIAQDSVRYSPSAR